MRLLSVLGIPTPSIRFHLQSENEDDLLISFRWGDFGWDHIRTSEYRLTQWGRKARLPLRFICRVVVEETPRWPIFLYSSKWKKLLAKPGFVYGRTYNPLDVGSFWRKADERLAPFTPLERVRARVRSLGLGQ